MFALNNNLRKVIVITLMTYNDTFLQVNGLALKFKSDNSGLDQNTINSLLNGGSSLSVQDGKKTVYQEPGKGETSFLNATRDSDKGPGKVDLEYKKNVKHDSKPSNYHNIPVVGNGNVKTQSKTSQDNASESTPIGDDLIKFQFNSGATGVNISTFQKGPGNDKLKDKEDKPVKNKNGSQRVLESRPGDSTNNSNTVNSKSESKSDKSESKNLKDKVSSTSSTNSKSKNSSEDVINDNTATASESGSGDEPKSFFRKFIDFFKGLFGCAK